MTRRLLSIGLTALCAVACASHAAPPPRETAEAGWQVSRRPVIPAGSLRRQAMWNDPDVVRDGPTLVMYLTTSIAAPFAPPVLPFRAVADRGGGWRLEPATPLLAPVAPYASIETPSVVRFDGRWHMFFTGVMRDPQPSPMAIGHAISADGIHWQVDAPVVLAASGKAGDWRSYLVAEPGAIVVGDRLLLFFSAVGARVGAGPPQSQTIGVAESTDGVHFGEPRIALRQTARFPADRGYAGYSSPAAVVADGRLHLFYSVAHYVRGAEPEWRQVAIAEAEAAVGTTSFAEHRDPVLTLASTGWTGGEILAPAPLATGQGIALWFGGHAPLATLIPAVGQGRPGGVFGIGFARRLQSAGGNRPA